MLRFHGSKAKRIFEYIGTNSRLDEIQAAALRIFLRELDRWTALRREAAERYRSLGLGEACEVPADEPGHVYHLFVSRSPQRDEIRAALTEAADRERRLLLASAPPPAGASLPRIFGRRPSRDRACGEGELLGPALGRDHGGATGAGRRHRSRGARRSRVVDALSDQPTQALAGCRRRAAGRRRLDGRVVRPLRRRHRPRLLRPLSRLGRLRADPRDQAADVLRVRLLQPLVALRLDPGHVGGRPRGRCGFGRSLSRLHPARLPPRERSAWHLVRRPPRAARVRRRSTPARAHPDRAAVGRDSRGARQGGRARRRRRCLTADPARDAEEPGARLHADRSGRRRSAQEEPALARNSRARHDRRAPPAAPRPPPGRAPHRDSVRFGRGARAHRRDRTQGERAGQYASRPAGADHGRLQPDRADPPGRGRGPARPRAGRGRHRLDRGLPHRRGRARHRRGRLDRVGALPPDRADRPDPARARRQLRVRAVRDRARAGRRTRASARPPPFSRTPATRRRSGRSSRSTGRPSSSTRLRTSTSRSSRRTRSRPSATTR